MKPRSSATPNFRFLSPIFYNCDNEVQIGMACLLTLRRFMTGQQFGKAMKRTGSPTAFFRGTAEVKIPLAWGLKRYLVMRRKSEAAARRSLMLGSESRSTEVITSLYIFRPRNSDIRHDSILVEIICQDN